MIQDPLGLTGKSRDIEQKAFTKSFKKAEKLIKRSAAENQKLLNKIFAPLQEEKMRRKWDFKE